MNYTHNLKIILLDKNKNIVKDDIFLEEIKDLFTKNNMNICLYNNKIEQIFIKWDRIKLNKIEKTFMGDLFSFPIYEIDSLIIEHTKKTIEKIKSKYTIYFYISRMLTEKIILQDTIGII
jgi:hypothetical protein